MRSRLLTAFATASLVAVGVSAQSPKPASSAAKRTADGHPDLQGVYDLATLTPVERPAGVTSPVYTDVEAKKIELQAASRKEYSARAVKADRDAPPKGGDGSAGAAGNVGGYNSFWIDAGSALSIVDGQKRSSIVVDPENGRVPPLTAQARQRALAARNQAATSDQTAAEDDPGFERAPGAYDDPERRPLGERCLMGFGSTSGPPMLPDYFYNNLHQIVQTPDHIMILTEMVHDARVVRMNQPHVPPTIRKWMGDSVGHWEGDTLVVDTTNFTEKTRFRGSSPDLHIVERFTRTGPHTLLYRFTIEDPKTWTRPWTGEYTWPETQEQIYEYACHEGNYAMSDILRGARMKEADDAKKKSDNKNQREQ